MVTTFRSLGIRYSRLHAPFIDIMLDPMPKPRMPSYERIPPSEGPYMGLHIQGDVSGSETEAIVRQIEARFAQHGPVRLLVAYDAEPGLISAEDLYDNLRFAKLAGDKIAKMAVIGKRAWEETWIALFGLFGGIQARFFGRQHIKDALAWLEDQ